MRRDRVGLVLLCWVGTRVPLLLIALGALPYRRISYDVVLYERWSGVLREGHFPVHDVFWQYPPGAALAMLAPGKLPGSYFTGFVAAAVLADLVVCGLLLWMGRRSARDSSRAGAWAWVAAVPLLGPITYVRFDVLVAAVAVAALAVSARPALSGALAGAGAMIKVWPVLLLLGAGPRGRTWRAVGAAALCCALSIAAFAATMPGSLDFLNSQGHRGIQVESVPGSVFTVARHFGWGGALSHRYGSHEFVGPGVGTVANVALLISLAGFGMLLVWRSRARWRPATAYDAALAATLLMVVTSRVLSPQYLVWLLALGAACLTVSSSSQRKVAWCLVGCAALTQLDYPFLYDQHRAGVWYANAVVLGRNAVLIGLTVMSLRALWISTRRDAPAEGEAPTAEGTPRAPDFIGVTPARSPALVSSSMTLRAAP
jgi:Glycosyltransferase family 87